MEMHSIVIFYGFNWILQEDEMRKMKNDSFKSAGFEMA